MLAARGDLMLMVDADGASTFSELDKLEAALVNDGHFLAFGSRSHLVDEAKAKRAW
jgi:dolichyl-phosphate beta-glucosyltransferase